MIIQRPGDITIGLLIESANSKYSTEILQGTLDASRKVGCNIIRFLLTRNFYTTESQDKQIEIIYKTIKKTRIDGLIFLGWWQQYSIKEQFEKFKRRFSHIQLLSIGKPLEDIPGVFMDGGIYIAQMTKHLIKVHNCKKILFIPPIYPDTRFLFYKDVMTRYGLYDPELEISSIELQDKTIEDFKKRAEIALNLILDKRKQKIDAVISTYALEAAQLVMQLKQRGFKVPEDIAVTSYEDGDAAKFIIPPLTTIYYPFYELGYIACKKIISFIRKESPVTDTNIPSRLIFRKSCGCNITNRPGDKRLINYLSGNLLDLTNKEKKALCINLQAQTTLQGIENFLELLISCLKEKHDQNFITFFEKYLQEVTVYAKDVYAVSKKINILRKSLLPFLTADIETLMHFDDLWNHLQILIQERVKYILGAEQLLLSERDTIFNQISQNIISTFNVQKLLNVFVENLKQLGIGNCYVFLYNQPETLDYKLVLAYEDNQSVDINTIDPAYWKDKISVKILPQKREHILLLNHLHIQKEQIGFVLYEPGPVDESLYYSMSLHLSTALKGAFLVEKYQEANQELESTQKQLVDNAYKTGMANIALGTLHNAGNILTSLNISVDVLKKTIEELPLAGLKNITEMIKKNKDNLVLFFTNDSKGKMLIDYCQLLGKKITNIKTELNEHIKRSTDKIELIANLITSQQKYVGVKSISERIHISDIISDAISILENTLKRGNIEIIKEIALVSEITVDKTKLIHIIINLITNSIEALLTAEIRQKMIIFTVSEDEKYQYIKVADNGCGMDEKTRKKIFQMGYSTKKRNGRGYGLHSCAYYMHEMHGQIFVESAGKNKGTAITLQFPR